MCESGDVEHMKSLGTLEMKCVLYAEVMSLLFQDMRFICNREGTYIYMLCVNYTVSTIGESKNVGYFITVQVFHSTQETRGYIGIQCSIKDHQNRFL